VVRASLEGINAAATGLVASAAVQMLMPYLSSELGIYGSELWSGNLLNVLVVAATFLILRFTRVAPPMVVALGLMLGLAL